MLNLPKLLLLLERNFGRSSKLYDVERQGFAFPFLLEIQKTIRTFYYLIKIEDSRGYIDFKFYRIIDDIKDIKNDSSVIKELISEELTEDEIQYIISFFWGFYEGRAQVDFEINPDIEPFFRAIPSSLFVYGYWDGTFVERCIKNEEEFDRFTALLEEKYGGVQLPTKREYL